MRKARRLATKPSAIICLIGPSGCGKSTIFNIVAGLQSPATGRVLIDGEDAIDRVGYMLQKDLLLSSRTVLDNVVLGMEIQGMPIREARERAHPYLARYGLGGFENQYPNSLSGGMPQRPDVFVAHVPQRQGELFLAVRHRPHAAST